MVARKRSPPTNCLSAGGCKDAGRTEPNRDGQADGSKKRSPPTTTSSLRSGRKNRNRERQADGGKETLSADEQPQAKATDQTDDLLFPTEEELRAIKAHDKDAEKSSPA